MRGAITGLILSLLLPVSISRAASLSVRPDGAGDFPTIQAAVDYAAEGDTIVLSPGTFTGAGNVNVDSRSKGLLVSGQAGAAATTIDCAYAARGFRVHDNTSSFFVVSGVTITRGWGGTGGAIQCRNAAVEVRDAIITRSIACWGQVLGCVDGQALIVRCRLLNDTCVVGAPCYGPGAPICEGLSYGGPVSALRSTLEMIDSYGEGNANESSQAQIVYALDSSVQLAGNRFYRNITFDGGPEAYFEQCDVSATANEFIENAAWTSGIHLVQCTGEVRGNLFDGNRVHVGPGGIQAEHSSVRLSFNLLRDNNGTSIESNRSTGDITRNLIVGTQGDCCGYGMAIQQLGCASLRVENNTLYNNGVGSGPYSGWASELHLSAQSAWAISNTIIHDELDNVVACGSEGCALPPPPFPALNWMWGIGTIMDWQASGYCPDLATFEDPLFRDPAHDNFFLRPNSTCDVDTIINTHVWKQFCGALPKGPRPSGLLNISGPADAWPSGSLPGASYVLNGFSITNTYRYDASINYRVTSPSGLLRDSGDPLSLVGSTPVLAPGESFTPPPAALEVPAGSRNVVVKYAYAYAPALNIVDTVQTTIHFASPVPVRVTSFHAKQQGLAIALQWTTGAGAQVDGWHVYRAEAGGPFKRITGAPLLASARSYSDANIASSVSYRYRLVALDPDENLTGEVRITPSIALALEQNTPNPFRSQTTIRFSMPAPGRATLAVYAVDGALVRTLLDGSVDDVGGEVTWDGLDAGGRPASSGVYFCRFNVGAQSLTRKIVLAR